MEQPKQLFAEKKQEHIVLKNVESALITLHNYRPILSALYFPSFYFSIYHKIRSWLYKPNTWLIAKAQQYTVEDDIDIYHMEQTVHDFRKQYMTMAIIENTTRIVQNIVQSEYTEQITNIDFSTAETWWRYILERLEHSISYIDTVSTHDVESTNICDDIKENIRTSVKQLAILPPYTDYLTFLVVLTSIYITVHHDLPHSFEQQLTYIYRLQAIQDDIDRLMQLYPSYSTLFAQTTYRMLKLHNLQTNNKQFVSGLENLIQIYNGVYIIFPYYDNYRKKQTISGFHGYAINDLVIRYMYNIPKIVIPLLLSKYVRQFDALFNQIELLSQTTTQLYNVLKHTSNKKRVSTVIKYLQKAQKTIRVLNEQVNKLTTTYTHILKMLVQDIINVFNHIEQTASKKMKLILNTDNNNKVSYVSLLLLLGQYILKDKSISDDILQLINMLNNTINNYNNYNNNFTDGQLKLMVQQDKNILSIANLEVFAQYISQYFDMELNSKSSGKEYKHFGYIYSNLPGDGLKQYLQQLGNIIEQQIVNNEQALKWEQQIIRENDTNTNQQFQIHIWIFLTEGIFDSMAIYYLLNENIFFKHNISKGDVLHFALAMPLFGVAKSSTNIYRWLQNIETKIDRYLTSNYRHFVQKIQFHVAFALDNDLSGRIKTDKFIEELNDKYDIHKMIYSPIAKDPNDIITVWSKITQQQNSKMHLLFNPIYNPFVDVQYVNETGYNKPILLII